MARKREESTKIRMEAFNKLEGKVKGMKGFLVILLPWYLLFIIVNL
jgi:hypothetical protein